MGLFVKNIMTRYQARLYRRQLQRYVHGMFLKVGDKKIPPGKDAEVDFAFRGQVDFLLSLGVLEKTGQSGEPPVPVKTFVPAQPVSAPITSVPPRTIIPQVFADFEVICVDGGKIFPDDPVEKPKADPPPVISEAHNKVFEPPEDQKTEIQKELDWVTKTNEVAPEIECEIEPESPAETSIETLAELPSVAPVVEEKPKQKKRGRKARS